MLTSMTEWMALIGVVVAAGATVVVQLVINRGEPAAIKRIKLLNEAIGGIDDDDDAKQSLIGARNRLATRLAKNLIGLEGFARVLQVSAWTAMAVGLAGLVLSFVLLLISPVGESWWSFWLQFSVNSVAVIVFSPLLLVLSALWPGYVSGFRELRDLIRDRAVAKGVPEDS